MYITLETDYAVRIIIFLAREKKRIDAQTISNNTGVSLRFALKILRNLVKEEIVRSYKGAQGGYEISCDPKTTSLRRVIEITEGEYMMSRCLSKNCDCSAPTNYNCKLKMHFGTLTRKMKDMMDDIYLVDLM